MRRPHERWPTKALRCCLRPPRLVWGKRRRQDLGARQTHEHLRMTMRFHVLVCALSALLPGSFRVYASGGMAATSPFLLGNSIKTAMANERTFFKWLFFGFHIGAMGTFILTFFSPAAPGRVTMVLFTWAVAFFFIFYGLARYYTRRTAIRNGLRDPADWEDAAAPALMAGALLLVVGSIVVYAFVTDQVPAKHAK